MVCACGNPVKDVRKERLEELLKQYSKQKGALIPVLQEAQEIYGYLPKDVMEEISSKLRIPFSKIYGVATFYAQFHLKPRGRHVIRVCQGTACHVRGSAKILNRVESELGIKSGQTTEDLRFTIEPVACLGACGLAPVMMIDEDTHGRMTPDMVPEILKQYE